MKWIITLLSCFLVLNLSAQKDLLLLKENNQTLQSWTTGSYILFQFSSKQWIEGIIKSIKNDSVLIDQITVKQIPNPFGFPTLDTAHFGLLQFHVNEIVGMPKRSFGNNPFSNGTVIQLGSAAYLLLNITNSLIKGDAVLGTDNLPGLGIAAGCFLLGKFLANHHKTYLQMGKKYRMITLQI